MKILQFIFILVSAFAFISCNLSKKNDSPKEVFSKFLSAKADKDVETVKKLISSGSLKMIQRSAEDQKTTVDELLKVDDQSSLSQSLEIGDEKIEGETATVEVKNPRTQEWEKMPFITEDGKWKIALDTALAKAEENFRERIRNSPDESSGSNANSNTNQK